MKLTLLCFDIETSFAELFKYFFDMLEVCKHVIKVDEYIIKVDYNIKFQKIREYIVHKLLEGHENIKTKWYYKLFK